MKRLNFGIFCDMQAVKRVQECGYEVDRGAAKASPLGLQRFLLVKASAFVM
jgi:hypothetical protein